MASFLVDTSIWIDFFRGKLSPSVYSFLCEGIRWRVAAITDIIHHEILVGAKDGHDFGHLRRLLHPLPQLRIADAERHFFEDLAWDLRRKGLHGRYTDVAIAFVCVRKRIPLMAIDRYFHRLAERHIIRLVP